MHYFTCPCGQEHSDGESGYTFDRLRTHQDDNGYLHGQVKCRKCGRVLGIHPETNYEVIEIKDKEHQVAG